MSQISALARRIADLPPGRRLVAVAGPPASGKSTVAVALVDAIRKLGRSAAVIPMDGFHLDNRILDDRGLRARKGAPETFDAAGFASLVRRIKEGGPVIYPLFDRSLDLAIAGAGELKADTEIALFEGNYLAFDHPDWRGLADLWDLCIFYDVPPDEIRARCIQRWLDHGHSQAQAEARADDNDMPNARTVLDHRLATDVVLTL